MNDSVTSIPCIIKNIQNLSKEDFLHILAGICKSRKLDAKSVSVYSELITRTTHLLDSCGFSEDAIQTAIKEKQFETRYCEKRIKLAKEYRKRIDFYIEDNGGNSCLLCQFFDPDNQKRYELESELIYAIMNSVINVQDLDDHGGISLLFSSWSLIDITGVPGNWPVLRFTYHLAVLLTSLISSDLSDKELIGSNFMHTYYYPFLMYSGAAESTSHSIFPSEDAITNNLVAFLQAFMNHFHAVSRREALKIMNQLATLSPSPKKNQTREALFKESSTCTSEDSLSTPDDLITLVSEKREPTDDSFFQLSSPVIPLSNDSTDNSVIVSLDIQNLDLCHETEHYHFIRTCMQAHTLVIEYGIQSGIAGLLIFNPETSKTFFASSRTILAGAVKKILHSCPLLLTSDSALLNCILTRFKIKSPPHLVDLHILANLLRNSDEPFLSHISVFLFDEYSRNLIDSSVINIMFDYVNNRTNFSYKDLSLLVPLLEHYPLLYKHLAAIQTNDQKNLYFILLQFSYFLSASFDMTNPLDPVAHYCQIDLLHYAFTAPVHSSQQAYFTIRFPREHEATPELSWFFIYLCSQLNQSGIVKHYSLSIREIESDHLSIHYDASDSRGLSDALWDSCLSAYHKIFHQSCSELELHFH